MRRRRSWTLSVGLACLGSVAAGGGPVVQPVTRVVERTIAHLDAPDPVVRNAATEALVNAGPAVRPAALAALPGASPEAAARLATILLRTVAWDPVLQLDPQAEHGPPPAYEALADDDRAVRVASVKGDRAIGALIQVLTSDPSPAVRWVAADVLRSVMEPPQDGAEDGPADPTTAVPGPAVASATTARVLALADGAPDAASYPLPSDNGPLLAAAAWAAQQSDPARADALMGRALSIEVAHPSAFHDQAKFAYLWAIDRATDRGDFAAAAALSRQLAARTACADGQLPDAVADLFALHAEYGPFPGFADDLRLYRPYLARPELIYCLARLAERQGGVTGRATAAGLTATAMAVGGISVDAHCDVGLFLLRHNWPGAARRELEGSRWLPGAGASADLNLALHALANDCDDDVGAARYLEAVLHRPNPSPMSRTTRYGQTIPWTEADQWAEVHWHYLRAAVTAGDRVEALARARKVLDLDETGRVLSHDPGMAADIVPVLADAGRLGEADRCFSAAYKALGDDVAKHPADPMPKNNLAWLCARADRHLDEADRLSADAVRLAPTDAACMDTRAEVLSRTGHPKAAAALEAKALAAKPEDVYMQRQIKRFRAAAGG